MTTKQPQAWMQGHPPHKMQLQAPCGLEPSHSFPPNSAKVDRDTHLRRRAWEREVGRKPAEKYSDLYSISIYWSPYNKGPDFNPLAQTSRIIDPLQSPKTVKLKRSREDYKDTVKKADICCWAGLPWEQELVADALSEKSSLLR